MLKSESGILYVRAALSPLARKIKARGGIANYLSEQVEFKEIVAPHFYPNRYLWQSNQATLRTTNSGALGKALAKEDRSCLSSHPTHTFVGYGDRVCSILKEHDQSKSCFYPIDALANRYDFSMLLLGCVDSSPGFSTVHATQYQLGLSQKHLFRYLMRWDYIDEGNVKSKTPLEYPGCSASFFKFYELYDESDNLISGEWDDVKWIFIPSARKAMEIEHKVLSSNPRFVKCNSKFCPTCTLRLY